MYRLVITQEALSDIEALFDYYDLRKPGEGAHFVDKLGDRLIKIEASPDRWQHAITNQVRASGIEGSRRSGGLDQIGKLFQTPTAPAKRGHSTRMNR